jgi:1,4-alpha-glucan branching enzyme
MGCETAQKDSFDTKVENWYQRELASTDPMKLGMKKCYEELNNLYLTKPALNKNDTREFELMHDSDKGLLGLKRKNDSPNNEVIVLWNYSDSAKQVNESSIETDEGTNWKEIFHSDWQEFAGKTVKQDDTEITVENRKINIEVPAYSLVMLEKTGMR